MIENAALAMAIKSSHIPPSPRRLIKDGYKVTPMIALRETYRVSSKRKKNAPYMANAILQSIKKMH